MSSSSLLKITLRVNDHTGSRAGLVPVSLSAEHDRRLMWASLSRTLGRIPRPKINPEPCYLKLAPSVGTKLSGLDFKNEDLSAVQLTVGQVGDTGRLGEVSLLGDPR